MKHDKVSTSRRDFLKNSMLGGAAAIAVTQVPAAVSAQTAPAAAPPAAPTTPRPAAPVMPPFSPIDAANSPMGTAFGVKPGRVAWAFNAKATNWDGVNNAPGWWDDSNTHPELVAAMLSGSIRSVGGDANSDKEAWNKIFVDFNKRHGKGSVGYKKGEKIVLKYNLNQVHNNDGKSNDSYIAPQLSQALLRQLVQQVGVAPADITVYDAIRNVPATIFDRATKEFPGVHFAETTGTEGREKAVPDKSKPLVFAQGGLTFYLPTVVTKADYMINVAGLKGHTMAGMTVCAKNHQGTVLKEDGSLGARDVHPTIAVKGGGRGPAPQQMGAYNGLVDMNGHPDVGGKTMLYIIDGLYASHHNEYRLVADCKWDSAPFNGNWTSSVFASQDLVAIDSVALDFLRSEPTLKTIVTGAVDNYLHEMSMAHQAPSKTVYDPAKSGKVLASMGVHEHWNNATDKKYSRNLGSKGTGIELVNVKLA